MTEQPPDNSLQDLDDGGEPLRYHPTSSPRGPLPVAPSAVLRDSAQTETFRRRADWLEREAKRSERASTRARLLLAASELRALLGELRRARRLAQQARLLSPSSPLIERQARSLAKRQRDQSEVLDSLVREGRTVTLPRPLRVHALVCAAELQRLARRDNDEWSAHLTAAQQADPEDPRPYLIRLLTELAQPGAIPQLTLPASQGLEPLRTLLSELCWVRGDSAATTVNHLSAQLMALGRSIQAGEYSEALELCDRIRHDSPHDHIAEWIGLALSWHLGSPCALERAGRMWNRYASPLALDVLAVTAYQQASPTTLERLAREAKSHTHALSALASVLAPEHKSRPNTTAGEESGSAPASAPRSEEPLPDALLCALSRVSGKPLPDSIQGEELELQAGYLLATQTPQLADVLCLLSTSHPLRRCVELESAHTRSDWAAMGKHLELFASEGACSAAQVGYCSGLLAERAGEPDKASQMYASCSTAVVFGEAAVRAQLDITPESVEPKALRALSVHYADKAQRASLLTEALLQTPSYTPQAEALGAEIIEDGSQSLFAASLLEVIAAETGDADKALRWLTQQRRSLEQDELQRLWWLRKAYALPEDERRELLATDVPALDLLSAQQLLIWNPGAALCPLALDRDEGAASSSPEELAALALTQIALQTLPRESIEDANEPGSIADRDPRWELLPHAVRSAYSDVHDELLRPRSVLARTLSEEEVPREPHALLRALVLARFLGHSPLLQKLREQQQQGVTDELSWLVCRQEQSLAEGEEQALLRTAIEIGRRLSEPDVYPYAYLIARLQIDAGQWAHNSHLLPWLSTETGPSWALRLLQCQARQLGDDETLVSVLATLRRRASDPLDQAALSLRMGEAQLRLGRNDLALASASQATELAPENLRAQAFLAEALEHTGQQAQAAEALEGLASSTHTPTTRAKLFRRAAQLWTEAAADPERAAEALRQAWRCTPQDLECLKDLCEAHSRLPTAEPLLQLTDELNRSPLTSAARHLVNIYRAKALNAAGHHEQALQVVEALASEGPDDPVCRNLLGQVYAAQGNHAQALDQFRLALALSESAEHRLPALRGIADSPETSALELTRVLQELLDLAPQEAAARRKLVRHLLDQGDREAALVAQQQLIDRAHGDAERLQAVLERIELHSERPEEHGHAEVLLEQASRTWPDNPQVLKAEVAHYRAAGRENTALVVLERATQSARRAISAGRFDASLFRCLEIACRLNADEAGARAAQATLAALRQKEVQQPALGASCAHERFEQRASPELLSPALRRLFGSTGRALERTFATDTVGALEITDERARSLLATARAFGLPGVRLLVSKRLGYNCVPMAGPEPALVFGDQLLVHADPCVVEFLTFRALKIAQLNACALCALPKGESWAVVMGWLACFTAVPDCSVERAQALIRCRERIRFSLVEEPPNDLKELLPALVTSIAPRAQDVAMAVRCFANRCALLGVGSISKALEALWLAGHTSGHLPRRSEDYIAWAAGSEQAADLVAYSVSEAFTGALPRVQPPSKGEVVRNVTE